MNRLANKLNAKFEEVKDLYSRGLLSVMYMSAWEDAMEIAEAHVANEDKPIMVLADECNCQLRMWTQNHIDWNASVRPQSKWLKTEMISGHTYEEMEFKVKSFLKALHKKETNFDAEPPKAKGVAK